jgi:hypothetical protein
MANRINRSDCAHEFDSPEEIEDLNQRERLETRAKNAPPK